MNSLKHSAITYTKVYFYFAGPLIKKKTVLKLVLKCRFPFPIRVSIVLIYCRKIFDLQTTNFVHWHIFFRHPLDDIYVFYLTDISSVLQQHKDFIIFHQRFWMTEKIMRYVIFNLPQTFRRLLTTL